MAQPHKRIDGIEIVDYRELKIKGTIGSGAFGIVYIAEYLDRRIQGPVVMKQIYEPADQRAQQLFMKEAKLLNGLHHAHIINMYGICVCPLVIIMEYVFFDFKPFLNKNLRVNAVDKFLSELSKLRTWEKLFDPFIPKIAADVTKGLSYLHNLQIAHRDLKPMNILISNQHYCDLDNSVDLKHRLISDTPVVCKLADFGESRSQLLQTSKQNDPSTNILHRGTIPFMAPEILLTVGMLNFSLNDLKRVDIWALGQVFYCLLNPSVSYPFQREGVEYIPQIIHMHQQHKRPSADPKFQLKHTTVWSRVHTAFEACTKHNPSERPNATDILVVLNADRPANRHTASPSEQTPPEKSRLVGRPNHVPGVQWYVGTQGEAALKYLCDELDQIASSKVNMSRSTVTHNISVSFTFHEQEWKATFPFDFPRSKATLFCSGIERKKVGGDTFESAVKSILGFLVSSVNRPPDRSQENPGIQWYSGDRGEANLRYIFNELDRIADGKVNMRREKDTQNITLQFEHKGQTWKVQFPSDFPRSKANLIRDGQANGKIGGIDTKAALDGLVTRILSVKEPAAEALVQEAHEGTTQWYVGNEGEAALKHVYDKLKEIANGEVKMSRSKDNQDVKISLERHGERWEVIFPNNFPRSHATLKRNGDEYRKASGNSVETATSAIMNHISGEGHVETVDELDLSGLPVFSQWYNGDQGEASLRYVVEELGQLADSDVRMSRNKNTQDVTLRFERHGKHWEVNFPSNFPSCKARLIFNGVVEAQVGGSNLETAVAAIRNHILSVDQPGAKTLHWKPIPCVTS